MGTPSTQGKCICVRDTAGLHWRYCPGSSQSPLYHHLSVHLWTFSRKTVHCSLSGSCSPLFQACVANWQYKRHWWTVSVLTSTEFSTSCFDLLGTASGQFIHPELRSTPSPREFLLPIYFLTFFFSCGLAELSLKSMESYPSSLLEQDTVLSTYSKTTEISGVSRKPPTCIA